MVSISNNGIIEMYKGDTFMFPLFINVGDKFDSIRYRLQTNDKVYFTIAEPHQPFECSTIRKIFDSSCLNNYGDVVVRLDSSDTENVLPGTYYMEIKIKLNNGNTSTIVPKRKVVIYE